MPKFTITVTEEYEVEAPDLETARTNFHHYFQDTPLDVMGNPAITLTQDDFEYIGGTVVTAEA